MRKKTLHNGFLNEVLTAEEAALYLKISLPTLYRYMRRGELPCFKVGNRWRFKKSMLDAWMEKQIKKMHKVGKEES